MSTTDLITIIGLLLVFAVGTFAAPKVSTRRNTAQLLPRPRSNR
jgi:hypothetical protein